MRDHGVQLLRRRGQDHMTTGYSKTVTTTVFETGISAQKSAQQQQQQQQQQEGQLWQMGWGVTFLKIVGFIISKLFSTLCRLGCRGIIGGGHKPWSSEGSVTDVDSLREDSDSESYRDSDHHSNHDSDRDSDFESVCDFDSDNDDGNRDYIEDEGNTPAAFEKLVWTRDDKTAPIVRREKTFGELMLEADEAEDDDNYVSKRWSSEAQQGDAPPCAPEVTWLSRCEKKVDEASYLRNLKDLRSWLEESLQYNSFVSAVHTLNPFAFGVKVGPPRKQSCLKRNNANPSMKKKEVHVRLVVIEHTIETRHRIYPTKKSREMCFQTTAERKKRENECAKYHEQIRDVPKRKSRLFSCFNAARAACYRIYKRIQ